MSEPKVEKVSEKNVVPVTPSLLSLDLRPFNATWNK